MVIQCNLIDLIQYIVSIRDRSFFMCRGGGGRWFLGGASKHFELKGGAIPKVEGGRGFLQVNVQV